MQVAAQKHADKKSFDIIIIKKISPKIETLEHNVSASKKSMHLFNLV